jgi:outer membrane protein
MATSLLLALGPISVAALAAPLTFEESVTLAVQRNATLRNARAGVAAAEERARAAHSGFLPQVFGDASYTDRSGSAQSALSARSDYSASVTVTQNLFAGFQDQARVEQGAANVEIAQATLGSVKAQLSRDLKTGYAGLSYAQDSVVLTQDILQRLEENLRLVQLRFESGRENKGSLLLSQASVAQGRFERLQAEQALTSAQAQLATVIGQGGATGRGVANRMPSNSAVPDLRAVGTVPLNAPSTVLDYAALVRDTPDLRDALARERSANADVQLARAGFYPSVNVSGTVGRDGSTFFPSDDSRVLSATVSIPLYSGGRDYYSERGALAALEAAKANRESVEGQVLVRLKQSYAAYVESVEQLKVAGEFVTAAETRATIARARYENGLMTFEDWDRIENDLIQRRKALLVSQRDRVSAEAVWEAAQGKGVIP